MLRTNICTQQISFGFFLSQSVFGMYALLSGHLENVLNSDDWHWPCFDSQFTKLVGNILTLLVNTKIRAIIMTKITIAMIIVLIDGFCDFLFVVSMLNFIKNEIYKHLGLMQCFCKCMPRHCDVAEH